MNPLLKLGFIIRSRILFHEPCKMVYVSEVSLHGSFKSESSGKLFHPFPTVISGYTSVLNAFQSFEIRFRSISFDLHPFEHGDTTHGMSEVSKWQNANILNPNLQTSERTKNNIRNLN